MSLNWSIKNVADYKKLYRKLQEGEQGYVKGEKRVTLKQPHEHIIWLTMTVGMDRITNRNYEQFYNRVNLHERVNGVLNYHRKRGKMIEKPITQDEIKRMIGLSTNASTLTKARFVKNVIWQYENYDAKL